MRNLNYLAAVTLWLLLVCIQPETKPIKLLNEPPHDKSNEVACAPSKDSDQPGLLPSLIRVLAVHSMGSLGPKLSSCGQRRL